MTSPHLPTARARVEENCVGNAECGMRMPVGGARLGVRHYVGLQEVASRGSSAASPASDKPAERRRAQVLMHRFV